MTIDPRLSVSQLIQHHPAALPLLAAAGIDTCCGGELPLEEAAGRAGVDLPALLRQLAAETAARDVAAAAGHSGCACGCKEN
jgi:regulator of cell morphogenesis and NO signaling